MSVFHLMINTWSKILKMKLKFKGQNLNILEHAISCIATFCDKNGSFKVGEGGGLNSHSKLFKAYS